MVLIRCSNARIDYLSYGHRMYQDTSTIHTRDAVVLSQPIEMTTIHDIQNMS